MFRVFSVRAALLSCALACTASAGAQEFTIAEAPNVFVNCQYRVAAIFPGTPMTRDIMYTIRDKTVPARQFYVEKGMDLYSVTSVDLSSAPSVDSELVEDALVPLRARGQVRFQYPEDYTPGIPGRQLNVLISSDRLLRASIYMIDHRMIITETYAAPTDTSAIQFEQSSLMIDNNGADYNNVANRQRYRCEK